MEQNPGITNPCYAHLFSQSLGTSLYRSFTVEACFGLILHSDLVCYGLSFRSITMERSKNVTTVVTFSFIVSE